MKTKTKLKETEKVTVKYCSNCINKRVPQFSILIAGQKIDLCKNCWIGFAYGLKQDFEIFNRSEQKFRDNVYQTLQNENKK